MVKKNIKIPGISTKFPVGIAQFEISYDHMIVWTNKDDNHIHWMVATLDENGNLGSQPGDQKTTFVDGGNGPALTSWHGNMYLAFRQPSPQTPSNAEPVFHQPPVIMVSRFVLSTLSWSDPIPLWNPGLHPGDVYRPAYQGPSAISSPAIASAFATMTAAWVELATNGDDQLAHFLGGVDLSPAPQYQIYYSFFGMPTWSSRKPVVGAFTKKTPALAAGFYNNAFLAWKGVDDNNIYFAMSADAATFSKVAKLPDFETSDAPALAYDGGGRVHLFWKDKSGTAIYTATLEGDDEIFWSPDHPGAGWSPKRKIQDIETSGQLAISSQTYVTDGYWVPNADLMLVYKGTGETADTVYLTDFDVSLLPELPGS
jgi:hypothetical protein